MERGTSGPPLFYRMFLWNSGQPTHWTCPGSHCMGHSRSGQKRCTASCSVDHSGAPTFGHHGFPSFVGMTSAARPYWCAECIGGTFEVPFSFMLYWSDGFRYVSKIIQPSGRLSIRSSIWRCTMGTSSSTEFIRAIGFSLVSSRFAALPAGEARGVPVKAALARAL